MGVGVLVGLSVLVGRGVFVGVLVGLGRGVLVGSAVGASPVIACPHAARAMVVISVKIINRSRCIAYLASLLENRSFVSHRTEPDSMFAA
jgi:hypothetical protein